MPEEDSHLSLTMHAHRRTRGESSFALVPTPRRAALMISTTGSDGSDGHDRRVAAAADRWRAQPPGGTEYSNPLLPVELELKMRRC